MKLKINLTTVLMILVLVLNLLVVGPIGWILTTLHENYRGFKVDVKEQMELKLDKSDYELDQSENTGAINKLEGRIYEYFSRQPDCSNGET